MNPPVRSSAGVNLGSTVNIEIAPSDEWTTGLTRATSSSPATRVANEVTAPSVIAARCATIVTGPGDAPGVDFVSRFFAPAQGIPEDPVTGSAHCTLIPFWAQRLGKTKLFARQVSARGGELFCELAGDRVRIGGRIDARVGRRRLGARTRIDEDVGHNASERATCAWSIDEVARLVPTGPDA